MTLLILFLAGLWAGAQNALAGGGSFITLAALVGSGVDPRAANVTSAMALFPAQCVSGWAGRSLATGGPGLGFKALAAISLAGGLVGAGLLLATPSTVFARMVPWLVLIATGIFALGAVFKPKADAAAHLGPALLGLIQFVIAIYGGYFGGGIGFLMMAAFALAGYSVRSGAATKNVLAGVMNVGAVMVFAFSPLVHWIDSLAVGAGAVIGGWLGAHLLKRAPDRLLRAAVIVIGVTLTVALFLRQP